MGQIPDQPNHRLLVRETYNLGDAIERDGDHGDRQLKTRRDSRSEAMIRDLSSERPVCHLPKAVPSPRLKVVNEIVFEITQEADGGFCAECLTESIFTQGDTWDELRANVKEAVEAFYLDRPKPAGIRLHLVRDEMLALG